MGVTAHIPGSNRKLVFLLLIALIAIASAYSLLTAAGPSQGFGDDIAYAWSAHYAAQGAFQQNTGDIFTVRLLQILPIGFFYWAFGAGQYSSAAWDMASFIGTLIIVFYLGKELYNEYAGLIAAVLFAFMPTVLQLSGTMSDNPPMMFFAALAMLALLYGLNRKSRKWYLISGIAMVSSFLVTPEGLFIWVVMALYVIARFVRRGFKFDKNEHYLLYGAILVAAVLAAYSYATVQNPLITFSFTFNFFQTNSYSYSTQIINAYPMFYIDTMFPYNVLSTLYANLSRGNFDIPGILAQMYFVANNAGLYFYFAVLAAAFLLIRREKSSYFVLFWFIAGFLVMELDPYHISLSPFSYILQHRLDRYLTFIAPPAAVIIAIAAVRIVERSKGKASHYMRIVAVAAALVFLVGTAIPIDMYWHSVQWYETYNQLQIANYLNALPNNTRIYYNTGQTIPIYMGFRNQSRFMAYDQLDNCSQLQPNSYIGLPVYSKVYNTEYTPAQLACAGWRPVLLPVLQNASADVSAFGNAAMTQLYYIPANGVS